MSDYVIDRIDALENGELEYWAEDEVYFYYVNTELKREVVLDPDFVFVSLFNEGLAPVVNKEKLLGFIDETGELAIEPACSLSVAGAYPVPYLVIPEFKGGFAYIKAFKGYIDRHGKAFFSGEQLSDHYDFSH